MAEPERYDYVVVGNPVAHSRSPEIHALFAAQTGERLSYGRLEAQRFEPAIEAFFAAGGLGANVTVPFKNDAARWVDELDESARFAAAVNTIVRCEAATGTRYRGHNTDGAGLVADLRHLLSGSLAGMNVLVLGAGGAVRGVLAPLAGEAPTAITIANRSHGKAVALAQALGDRFPELPVAALSFAELAAGYDLVINGTSAGLGGSHVDIAPEVVRGSFCYDMSYGAQAAFMRFARAAGAAGSADGLGMLVEQAALSFNLWRGKMPDARAVLAQLRRGGE